MFYTCFINFYIYVLFVCFRIDTAVMHLETGKTGRDYKIGLKSLVENLLGDEIQNDTAGHDRCDI